jgi:hypothetical protein
MDRRLFPRIDDRGFLQHFRHPDDAANGGILKGDQRLRQQGRQHSPQCLGDDDVARRLKSRQPRRNRRGELTR